MNTIREYRSFSDTTLRKVLTPLLWLLSVLYGCAMRIRGFLYAHNIMKRYSVQSNVVCVGNLTAGGTGKTTTVKYCAGVLTAKGYKVAVLTRGYKGKRRGNRSQVLSDGSTCLLTVEEAGDEPYLLARELKGIPVIIGSNRYKSAGIAVERFHPDIILMDDGFQHARLERRSDIVLVDALDPFGGSRLLPLGFLREPLRALKRASIVILTHSDLVHPEDTHAIKETIRKFNENISIIDSIHAPVMLRNFASGEMPGLDWLRDKKAATLSSIGNPLAFELTVKHLCRELGTNYRFLDHHWYTGYELRKVIEQEDIVVTTEKDAVKIEVLNEIPRELLAKLYVVRVELKLREGDETWLNKIII